MIYVILCRVLKRHVRYFSIISWCGQTMVYLRIQDVCSTSYRISMINTMHSLHPVLYVFIAGRQAWTLQYLYGPLVDCGPQNIIHSFVRLFVPSFILPFVHLFANLFICSIIHSFIRLFVCLLTHVRTTYNVCGSMELLMPPSVRLSVCLSVRPGS